MTQNIYDNYGFFTGYSGLERSIHRPGRRPGMAGAAHPAAADASGLRVL